MSDTVPAWKKFVDSLEIDIRRNSGGGLCANFYKLGHEYFADLSDTMDHGPECMIFPYDDERRIGGVEVFTKWYDSVSEENLVDSIEEFLSQQAPPQFRT